MKVCDLPYRRVTLEEVSAVMEDVIPRIKNAKSVEEILAAREDYLKTVLEFSTNASLASMRYTINTVDEFYVAENEYYDEIGPSVQNYNVAYSCALLDSPFRAELEKALSPVLFQSMEVERKAMSETIIEDMVTENKLVREYSDLMAGMEFEFRGEKLPRAMLMKYAKDPDRPRYQFIRRKKAVSFTRRIRQYIQDSTPYPVIGIRPYADTACDLIGYLKAHSINIICQ